MLETNNFKELEKEQEKLFEEKSVMIKNSLDANMGSIRLFSDVIELYFSKLVEFFVKIAGGDINNKNDNNSQ